MPDECVCAFSWHVFRAIKGVLGEYNELFVSHYLDCSIINEVLSVWESNERESTAGMSSSCCSHVTSCEDESDSGTLKGDSSIKSEDEYESCGATPTKRSEKSVQQPTSNSRAINEYVMVMSEKTRKEDGSSSTSVERVVVESDVSIEKRAGSTLRVKIEHNMDYQKKKGTNECKPINECKPM